mmetsp:Transcript_38436/g.96473  ORF Transcript_38436/g.96473 Transcript_38436/m.96473 type:complete len:207 (-) Transcript_38436:2072-2692(-)
MPQPSAPSSSSSSISSSASDSSERPNAAPYAFWRFADGAAPGLPFELLGPRDVEADGFGPGNAFEVGWRVLGVIPGGGPGGGRGPAAARLLLATPAASSSSPSSASSSSSASPSPMPSAASCLSRQVVGAAAGRGRAADDDDDGEGLAGCDFAVLGRDCGFAAEGLDDTATEAAAVGRDAPSFVGPGRCVLAGDGPDGGGVGSPAF